MDRGDLVMKSLGEDNVMILAVLAVDESDVKFMISIFFNCGRWIGPDESAIVVFVYFDVAAFF